MSKINVFVAALLVAAAAVLSPSQSSATTSVAKVAIAGSTGVWQAMGLGAFNQDNQGCPTIVPAAVPPCFHYTDNTKFNLVDTRPDGYVGGSPIYDTADLWIIWDSKTTTRNVWYYIKPDTIIANKCYFANPRCKVYAPSGYVWSTVGQKISSTLWGADTAPPVDVQNLFLAGSAINTLMSELRPEDALFEQCRVNSALGNGTKTTASGLGDGLDGLGYNANNSSGTCPSYVAGGTAAQLAKLVGSSIKSGINDGASHFSTAASFVAAFNITGKDPFTNKTVVGGTEYNIGVFPIIFVFSNKTGAFTGVSDATDAQLQSVFSGANCNTNAFTGATSPGSLNVWLREPLSGTMTTTEMGAFRRQLETTPAWATAGNGAPPNNGSSASQETGVGANNPLSSLPCVAGGGARTRGIGTGEVINGATIGGVSYGGVQFSGAGSGPYTNDGIGYAFWSFGNVSKLTGATYSFLSLDGEDPLGIPGYSPGGILPTSITFPASEASIWPPSGGMLNSYPNVRAGKYTTWTEVRMFTSAGVNGANLVSTLFQTVVNTAPDFIPAEKTTDGSGNTDPGVQIAHTRFQQRDANGGALGLAPSNGTFTGLANGCNPRNTDADHGGEAGGCTISTFNKAHTKCIAPTFHKNKIQIDVTESGGSVSNCKTDRN